ncbi:glycosyltransferase WbuB [Candidatus Woesearchaeota archaeon CG06_land_8_20_14_3_00_33_13]|nr:MAG: glycosyltransferase WbuB [Candidatus Woesearchaeota archaeon CG06_land_8_20_14_3_00_33_13]
MENKNIWILNHYAVAPNMPGGTRHHDFGKELVRRGYNVAIFASSFHYSQHRELKLKKKEKYKIENVNGINFVWIKTFPYQKNDWRRVLNMISYMWRVYWLGRKIRKTEKNIHKPDVIIGSSVHLLAVLSAYYLSKYYKARFIMEVGDLWPQSLIDIKKIGKNSFIAVFLRFLEKFLYKRSSKIIILSPLAKNYLTAIGINQEKINLIPNGADVSKYKIVFNKSASDKRFKIMYTGSIGVVNALEPALPAMKIIQERGFKDIKLIFIGGGVEKSRLIEKAKRLKINNVDFLSFVPKAEVPSLLAKADAFLLMENKILYGSSNKLMDYMAAGRPIVFSTPAEHNLVPDANCGISASSQQPSSLAAAIIELYQMPPEKRRKMGKRGREYVEKYHNTPVLVDKLEKVFQELSNE